jgi:hypothetical protein
VRNRTTVGGSVGRGEHVVHAGGGLGVGAPGPAQDVVPIGEQRPQRWFDVAVPQLDAPQPPAKGTRHDLAHHRRAGQVEPDQQVRTAQQQWADQGVLPLGDPLLARGERGDVVDELGARHPAGTVVEPVDVGVRDPEAARQRGRHRRLP